MTARLLRRRGDTTGMELTNLLVIQTVKVRREALLPYVKHLGTDLRADCKYHQRFQKLAMFSRIGDSVMHCRGGPELRRASRASGGGGGGMRANSREGTQNSELRELALKGLKTMKRPVVVAMPLVAQPYQKIGFFLK